MVKDTGANTIPHFQQFSMGKSFNGEGGSCCGLFGDIGGLKIESLSFSLCIFRFQRPSNPKIFVGSALHHLFEEKEDGECMCVEASEVKAKLSFCML